MLAWKGYHLFHVPDLRSDSDFRENLRLRSAPRRTSVHVVPEWCQMQSMWGNG